MTDGGTIWVRTEPTPDGSAFMATISIGDDVVIGLDVESMGHYVANLTRVLTRAEYDALVFEQVAQVSGGTEQEILDDVEIVLRELRKKRDTIEWPSGWRLTFRDGVNPQGDGFIAIAVDGTMIGQWTPEELRGHRNAVLEAVATAQLDENYLEVLMTMMDLPEDAARNAVDSLKEMRVYE